MPIEQLELKSSTPITFRHPDIDQPLIIGTGANGLAWSYNLNTNVVSTYGGEVVQILSAFVDAITIHGQTKDNHQLQQIADWFLQYMQLAGLHNRDEHFVTMEYAERGWSLWIQPTQLPDFHYNRDEIAVEWSITAEIVADNDLNYLSQMTMSNYTETAFDPSMFDMKFMAHDPRNDPIHLNPALGLNIGDNFQSLLGAWATGDFAHWAFDSTADVSSNNLKQSREYWTQKFGTDTPFGSSSSNPNTAGGTLNLGNPRTHLEIAGAINIAAQAKGIPGYIMVASAMQESGLNPDSRQQGGDSAMGLFQSFPTGAAGSGAHASEVRQAFNNPSQPVTKYWSSINQITDATVWWHAALPVGGDPGQYAKRAQGAGDPSYAAKIDANIPAAKQLIAQAQASSSVGGPRAAQAARFAEQQVGTPYKWGGNSPGGFDCSGLCQWAYKKAGINIPRTTYEQIAICKVIPDNDAAIGDLVFCNFPPERIPGHVVMYIGNGNVVAAPQPGERVGNDKLVNFKVGGPYGCNFFQIGRVPNS